MKIFPLRNRKIPWRLSSRQKFRQRKRLRAVDQVVDTVAAALERNGMTQVKAVQRWYDEMPREKEMLPKDKYTLYDRKEKTYRKGIHSKQTNPPTQKKEREKERRRKDVQVYLQIRREC